MESGRRARRPRPPPTLRTKTGCLNCRSRRKKCDEHHPSCAACSKRKLNCSWPESHTTENGHQKAQHAEIVSPLAMQIAHRPTSIAIKVAQDELPRSSSKGCILRQPSHLLPINPGIDEELLDHYASKLCSVLLRNNAHPDFKKYFLMSTILPWLQLMVDPLFACASLDLSKQSPTYRGLAMKYYSQAVTDIRQNIAHGSVQGTEDWLLLNILHLNLFETWVATSSTPVLLHIQGAAEILKLRGRSWRDSSSQNRCTSDKVFARIAAEAFVFHTISWSIFNGYPITMSTDELWGFLEPYFAIRPFPRASDSENSPVLGVPWQVYRYLSDLTQLSHRLPLNSSDYNTALALTKDIDSWQSRETTLFVDGSEADSSALTLRYVQRTRLFTIALRLLLFKFLHPETHVFSPVIQAYVIEAVQLLQPHVIERFHFWPLLIIGSAVVQQDHADVIRRTLKVISENTNSGTFLKTTKVLETIWGNTVTANGTKDAGMREPQEDGLDLLLGRENIPGLINR